MSPSFRWVALAAGFLAVIVGSTVAYDARRDRAWAHGGDGLGATATVQVADAAGLPAGLTATGGKPDTVFLEAGQSQAVTVQVRWRRPARGGHYSLLVLDNRVSPPKPLEPRAEWAGYGEPIVGWDSRHDVLAERYPWLAGTASVERDGTWTSATTAVGASARQPGSIGGAFIPHPDSAPVTDPARDLLVVIFHTNDDGEVRWATRVPIRG